MDNGNARVQRWIPGAAYGTTVVSATMNNPIGLRIDRLGNIVVADTSYQEYYHFQYHVVSDYLYNLNISSVKNCDQLKFVYKRIKMSFIVFAECIFLEILY